MEMKRETCFVFFKEINLKLFEFLIFGGKATFLIMFYLDENYNWTGPFFKYMNCVQ